MKTRRQFLGTSMAGMAATWTLPAFLNHTILGMDLQAADSWTQAATGRDHPILVVLQMGGGNDGLNTVVPFADDAYYSARPSLGIAKAGVLRMNDYFGLNPQLAGLRNLYDSGNLAVVNGVGYPNPNRSHFRSMEIWQTASDAQAVEPYGWIGRYFDSNCVGEDPEVGVNIGSTPPQAFLATKSLGISMANPSRYRLEESGGENSGLTKEYQAMLNQDQAGTGTQSGSSIENLGGAVSMEGSTMEYLQRTALDAEISSQDIQAISRGYKNMASYPSSRLGNDLKLVAQLIGGGLKSRVYYVNQGGYDTHANQSGTHDRLMGEFSVALSAFCADLKAQGNFNRVLVMTFSEFGRRVAQNGSGGTDHGAAGPMFLLGGAVKPGVYGKYPSLTDLHQGDLKHQVDFRSVYATILEKWMKVSPASILRKPFPGLDFV